jgi:hypothetical protein
MGSRWLTQHMGAALQHGLLFGFKQGLDGGGHRVASIADRGSAWRNYRRVLRLGYP